MRVLFIFLLSTGLSPAGLVYDLVILAGQSNAVGFDAKPAELPKDPTDKKVLLWWKTGDPPPDSRDSSSNSWVPLAPQSLGNPAKKGSSPRQYGNFAQPEGGFGPEIGFARHILKVSPDRKLAILKVAFSGTSIPRDWDPGKQNQSDSCYTALIAEFKKASEAASKKGITLRPAAFLWVQGESDANKSGSKTYAANLSSLLHSLRKDFKSLELPALLAVNTRFGLGKNEFMPVIVEAQKEVARKDPNTTYVDTSKAPIANGAHFNSEGTLLVGTLFGQTFLSLKP